MLPFCTNSLKDFIKEWNRRIPIDKWFRDRYKIPFNSKSHRELSFIDMYIEYIEFIHFDYLVKKKEKQKEEYTYQRGKGNFMKGLNDKDWDDIFENLDLDNFD